MARSEVKTQMPKGSASMTGNPGLYGKNKPPFEKGQDMGNGGIPTRFFENIGGKQATTVPAPGQTAGPSTQRPRRGASQFPFGGNSDQYDK